jgi:hypothetical protein
MSQPNERRYSKGQQESASSTDESWQQRQAELTAFYEVGKELASTLDLNQLLDPPV